MKMEIEDRINAIKVELQQTKDDLKEIFSAYLHENMESADSAPADLLIHDFRYNPKLRKYFGFKEWFDFLLKEWERLD